MQRAATGLISSIREVKGASILQDFTFAFDRLGNLTSRGDLRQSRSETFTYDGLNRVTGTVLKNTANSQQLNTSSYTYDSIGNIANKSDVGAYVYGAGPAGPHAVTSAGSNTYAYDSNGNMLSGAGRTMTWTSFNKPRLIRDLPSGNETLFTYGPDRGRIEQRIIRGGLTTTVTYIDAVYEKRARLGEANELVHYIRAGATVAIYTKVDDGLPATNKTRYVHRDHLGSVTALSNESGAVTEYLSYDPHGKRRLSDWQPGTPAGAGTETPRGFTGHEMLDGVNLIHMNGRVYDPVLGRFTSADPFVPYPLTTQGFNRYTYGNNNSLSFTDPSGFMEDGPAGASLDSKSDGRGGDGRSFFDRVFDGIGDFVSGLADALSGLASAVGDAMTAAIDAVIDTRPIKPAGALYSDKYYGYHKWSAGPNETCSATCQPEFAIDSGLRWAWPGQNPNDPVIPGQKYDVIDPVTGRFGGPITATVQIDKNRLTVVHSTLPGHLFHDGQVKRTTYQVPDGRWFTYTEGVGNNVYPGMANVNEVVGPEIFNAMDVQQKAYTDAHNPHNTNDKSF